MGSLDSIPSGSGDEAFTALKIVDDTTFELVVEQFNQMDYNLPRTTHGYICELEGEQTQLTILINMLNGCFRNVGLS